MSKLFNELSKGNDCVFIEDILKLFRKDICDGDCTAKMSSGVLGVKGGYACSDENNVVVVEMDSFGFYNVKVIINQSKLNFKLCPHLE